MNQIDIWRKDHSRLTEEEVHRLSGRCIPGKEHKGSSKELKAAGTE